MRHIASLSAIPCRLRTVRSWLAKIEAVKRLLVDDAPDKKPEVDALAAAYVYLQWIATGAIQCVEGGGHHRPNRHGEHCPTLASYIAGKWSIPLEGSAHVAVDVHVLGHLRNQLAGVCSGAVAADLPVAGARRV